MSVKVKTKTTKTTPKTKQKFIRLNLDEKLNEILDFYQEKYTLLSKAEIVRMLLSEGVWKLKNSSNNKSNTSFKEIFDNFKQNNPVKLDLTEDEMFLEWEKFNQNNQNN
jgi:hypothetical protein